MRLRPQNLALRQASPPGQAILPTLAIATLCTQCNLRCRSYCRSLSKCWLSVSELALFFSTDDRCPPYSVFSQCAPGNTPTCADPDPVCTRVCTAGCICYEGYVWEHNRCIPRDQCGCYDAGTYYPVNNPCLFFFFIIIDLFLE